MSALKRIEEKYNGTDHILSPRSDVLKLAQVLDAIVVDYMERVRLYGESENQPHRVQVMDRAKRTLKEVAGD